MSASAILRFGGFELNTGTAELRHRGDLVKLAPQPAKVLEVLVRRSGDIVARTEIREHVWCGDTFVDFEQGLNFCIRQIREALGDTADSPRFIETLPRRGYRFLVPLEAGGASQPKSVTRLIVLPFRMLRPDPDTEFLAFSLPDALTSSLSGLQSLVVRSSLAAARFAGEAADLKTVAAEADVDVIVTGTLLRAGDEVRVTTQLTEAASGSLLWSDSAQAPVGDIFRVQDDLAERIVASLSLPLTVKEHHLLHRDVPATAKAYEFFLRGNQLSRDSKQWTLARDLYQRSLEEDANYAPAWARLGRIHHVIGKYLGPNAGDNRDRAEAAFRRALEINPDLAVAHKHFAQFDVDRGRARDAMVRLAERAQASDPEVLAGLVTACRYCGLLEASVAAHARALVLEPKIRTSVPHTWYFQGDHQRVVTIKPVEFPYIVPLSMAELGRRDEAVAVLRELERKISTRVREIITAARLLLEDEPAESAQAVGRFIVDFHDPEGLFYAARHYARLQETTLALDLLERVVAGGFFCYPAMAKDPWLDSIRRKPGFTKLLRRAEDQHREAEAAFDRAAGASYFAR